MTVITAERVKELRERTGVGMMECKKALVAANGDIELAIEEMRKSGMAKAAKKAGRIAAEGSVVIAHAAHKAAMIEINSETDFVARDENFIEFCNKVSQAALKHSTDAVEALLAVQLGEQTVEEARQALISKIGENINVRRVAVLETTGQLGYYSHGSQIGVLVALEGGRQELARDIAMHIAASKPMVVAPEEVAADVIAKEKEIFMAQALESGKPREIVEKMVEGRIKKFLGEVSLLGQAFVKNPDLTIAQLLKAEGAVVTSFIRFEVGEGIEKQVDNFVEEVMMQARGK